MRWPLTVWMRSVGRASTSSKISPDLVGEMMKSIADQLMPAEADAHGGAGYGEHSAEWVNSHNGYRHRGLTPGPVLSTLRCQNYGRAATSRAGRWSRGEQAYPPLCRCHDGRKISKLYARPRWTTIGHCLYVPLKDYAGAGAAERGRCHPSL